MYSCKFVNNNGNVFLFGIENNLLFDVAGLSGVSVDIGTAQGFSQIGETVQAETVSGQELKISGTIFKNIPQTKAAMRNTISPFARGKFIFGDKYYYDVVVQNAPEFSPVKNNGAFSLRLFSAFPFPRTLDDNSFIIGEITPMFSFPVNYATPHQFGIKSAAHYANILNSGNIKTPFKLVITTETQSSNIALTNLETFKFLKLNGVLNVGEILTIYRDNDNQLRAEKTVDGETENVIDWIDESSDLFELSVGNNLILASDDEGGDELTVQIIFNSILSGVFEE